MDTSFFGFPRRAARRPKPGAFATEDSSSCEDDLVAFEAHFDDDAFNNHEAASTEDSDDFFATTFSSSDPQRVRRTELQERSTLRERVNSRITRNDSFEDLVPRHQRVPPVQNSSWALNFSDHNQPAAAAHPRQEQTQEGEASKPKSRRTQSMGTSGFWEDFLGPANVSRRVDATEETDNVNMASIEDTKVTTKTQTGSGELTDTPSLNESRPCTNGGDDDINSYDPYHVGKNDPQGDESSSSEESHTGRVKRMASGQSVDMARFLESSSWFGQGEVVVVSSRSSVTSSQQDHVTSGPQQQPRPSSPRQRMDEVFLESKAAASLQRVVSTDEEDNKCFDDGDNKSTENRENMNIADMMAASRQRAMRKGVPRRASASSIDWNSLLMTNTAPNPASDDDDDRRCYHHHYSSEKTKKNETIARASIVSSSRGEQPRRRSNKAIKGRGRRAVEVWRRRQRAEKKKEKKQEQLQYAFNLEFDPFVLKPVEFTSNLFRPSGSPKKGVFDDQAIQEEPVVLVEDDAQDTTVEKHGEAIAESEEWYKEMTDLFAVRPEQHRKNRASRASF